MSTFGPPHGAQHHSAQRGGTFVNVNVRYFASIREGLGLGQEQVQTEATTLGALRDELLARGGAYAEHLARGRAVRMAQRNIHANDIENASVVLDHTLSRFSNGHFNTIALNPPVEEGTETIFEMIERAQPKLKNGGSFYLVAKVRKGAKSYMRKLSETIGSAKVVLRSGGYWVMRDRENLAIRWKI